jgi:hypothetical protein
MRYLNTRDTFLTIRDFKPVNESTFTNDITWGGSLLGRLVNSIIRKAKIGINKSKIDNIALNIKLTLDELLKEVLTKEQTVQVDELAAHLLLEEIYKCVNSDEDDKKKLNQLLDKDNSKGLISVTIDNINKLSDNSALFNSDKNVGSKAVLIDKLEKFRDELTKLAEEMNVTPTAEEEPEEAEKGNENQDLYVLTVKILNSVIGISDCMKNANQKSVVKPINKIDNSNAPETKQIGTEKSSEPNQIGTKKSPETRVIEGPKTGLKTSESALLGFLNFVDSINEDFSREEIINKIKKSKNTLNDPNTPEGVKNAAKNVIKNLEDRLNKLDSAANTPENTTTTNVSSNNIKQIGTSQPKKENKESNIVAKVLNSYKNSGIERLIPQIKALLQDKNRKDVIVKIGKQIISNEQTIGKNKVNKLTEAMGETEARNPNEILVNDIPKAITILSNTLLAFKQDMGLLSQLSNFKNQKGIGIDIFIKTFISSFDSILKIRNIETPEEKKPEEKKVENLKLNYKDFLKILEDADTEEEDVDTEDEEDTEDAEEQSLDSKVKKSWFNYFKEGEEKQWAYDPERAKKLQKEVQDRENKPTVFDMSNDETKDKILEIANLFEKAYRCYVTKTIPSGRPGGRVSNQTYSEYIYLGKGEAPPNREDSGPGPGPWANRVVFEKFKDKITELLEYKKYQTVFNKGKILTTNGEEMSGNVLLEFIRNMIDETELKSFDAKRSILINKYFGLKVKTKGPEDEVEDEDDQETPENTGAIIKWVQPTDPTITNSGSHSVKAGDFIAIHGKTGMGKEYTIIGHVLKVDGNYALIKYQESCEGVAIQYGAKITKQWFPKKTGKLQPVFFGLIKLPVIYDEKTPKKFTIVRVEYKKVKNTNNEYTKEGDKGDNILTIEFKPFEKQRQPGELGRTSPVLPLAYLVSVQNAKTVRINRKNFEKNVLSELNMDIPINAKGVGSIDNIFEILKKKFNK